jgi:hypothetical protein
VLFCGREDLQRRVTRQQQQLDDLRHREAQANEKLAQTQAKHGR